MVALGAAREDLERRLTAERGWRIARWTAIDAGRMARASLFATWAAQGRDPLHACRQMLLTQTL
jgi:hypothetical protein